MGGMLYIFIQFYINPIQTGDVGLSRPYKILKLNLNFKVEFNSTSSRGLFDNIHFAVGEKLLNNSCSVIKYVFPSFRK